VGNLTSFIAPNVSNISFKCPSLTFGVNPSTCSVFDTGVLLRGLGDLVLRRDRERPRRLLREPLRLRERLRGEELLLRELYEEEREPERDLELV